MTQRIICGDALEELRKLPAESVHCVVTSPPYWGLRDYGTASWEGGDAGCDHVKSRALKRDSNGGLPPAGEGTRGTQSSTTSSVIQYPDICPKCGARRVDKQLGLEATPTEYLERMTAVFREVRRILRDDGVLFLNMGDSFASSLTINPQSRKLRDDITNEEKRYVILEMFGVRVREQEETGQGTVPKVLPEGIQGSEVCGRPDVESKGVAGQLSQASGIPVSLDEGEASETEVDGDQQIGREVCMLRRNVERVLDCGSHQRRRCGTSEKSNRKEQGEQCEDLQGHSQSGISSGQVPDSLFQLQLRDRLLGILSSHTFTDHEIPDSARFAFTPSVSFKPKDLVGMPWRLAFALQADGWWLRSDIIWKKPNPMPESVTDRPTKSHEYIFLLTKSARYFYDADAVRESVSGTAHARQRKDGLSPSMAFKMEQPGSGNRNNSSFQSYMKDLPPEAGRNARDVWTIATQAFPDAHFATFPEAIPERCIRAGTSERGCCPECGAPWRRVVESVKGESVECPKTQAAHEARNGTGKPSGTVGKSGGGRIDGYRLATGWEPTCTHGREPVPATILDPFGGACTTALVATKLNRGYIMIELNPEYVEMARRRLTAKMGLFAEATT